MHERGAGVRLAAQGGCRAGGVAVFFQAVSKSGPASGFFPRHSSPVPGIVITTSEPVTAEAAQQCGDRADNRRPGCSIHDRIR
jgi:hypothetical protein